MQIRTSDGVTYLGANRNGLDQVSLTGFEFAPDILVRGSFVIEMPADKLPGAIVEVMEKPILNDLASALPNKAPARPTVVSNVRDSIATGRSSEPGRIRRWRPRSRGWWSAG